MGHFDSDTAFNNKWLSEICSNCGNRRGSHLGTSYYSKYYGQSFPKDYCPGTEGRMDWDKGPGTIFNPSGKYKEDLS